MPTQGLSKTIRTAFSLAAGIILFMFCLRLASLLSDDLTSIFVFT
jgi:hypothetical protein